MRTLLVTLLKLALVAGLLAWLVYSGKLDFRGLSLLVSDPSVGIANVLVWGVGYVFLGTFRWYLLLRGLDLEVSFLRALKFQLIGLFFNTAMPGAVGGDVIKAVYVIREQNAQRRTPAMLTVLLDRVIGLAALFVLAAVAVLTNLSFFTGHPPMMSIAVFVAAGLMALIFGLALVLFPHKDGRDPVEKLLAFKLPGFGMLQKIYEALRCYRRRPQVLLATVGLSCVIQTGAIMFAWLVTSHLTHQTPQAGIFGTVYAVGVMTTAIPLAPGGLGVGHVAFDHLFEMAGLTGGASVFNVTALGGLALNLTGVIPYLLHRTKLPAATEDVKELAV